MKHTPKGVPVLTEETVEALLQEYTYKNTLGELVRRIEEIKKEDEVIGNLLMGAFVDDPLRAHFGVFLYELVARQTESYKMEKVFGISA